jgi:putative DNA primase/helicase
VPKGKTAPKRGVAKKLRAAGKSAGAALKGRSKVVAPSAVAPAREGKASLAWRNKLLETSRGELVSCPSNVIDFLVNHPDWRGVLQYDEFVGDITTAKPPPWSEHLAPAKSKSGDWVEKDMIRTGAWLAKNNYKRLIAATNVVVEGVRVAADRHVVHPVRDWLNIIKWDRKPRADTFFVRLAHAEDTPYVRAVSSKFLIGAVARIFEPGCQLDTMPILEGDQGIGKTSFLKILAGEWFLSTNVEPGTKDSYQVLKRKWIVEFGELDALGRSEISRIKQYISQPVDTYRPSYGSASADFPRQVVFAGTINPDGGGYLKDNTGARRFQPLGCGGEHGKMKFLLTQLARERDQLWAEAVHRFKAGEAWHLTDPKLIRAAAEVAESRRQTDPWETPVSLWLEKLSSSDRFKGVTTYDVLTKALRLEQGKLNRGDEMRISSVLRLVGWGDRRRARRDGQVWVFRPAKDGPSWAHLEGSSKGAAGAKVIKMSDRIHANSTTSENRKAQVGPGKGAKNKRKV